MNTKQRIVITVSAVILIVRCLWLTPIEGGSAAGYGVVRDGVNYERLLTESAVIVIAASGLVLLWRDKKKEV